MHSAGMLTPSASPDMRTEAQKQLWSKTNERMSKFLGPDFMANVVPQGTSVDAPATAMNPEASMDVQERPSPSEPMGAENQ